MFFVFATILTASSAVRHKDVDLTIGRDTKNQSDWHHGPDIYLDGVTVMKTQVYNLRKQFASEFLFRMDKNRNGITANGTHVIVPMNRRIQSMYIRRMNGADDEEVGVAMQRFSENSKEILRKSMIADDITIVVAEKMHAYSRKRPMSYAAVDRVRNRRRNHSKRKRWKTSNEYYRNLYTTAAATMAMPGVNLWRALSAPNEVIRNWASDGQEAPSFLHGRATTLRNAMDAKFTQLKVQNTNFSDPVMSSVNCFHWGAVTFDKDKEVMMFPLNRKLSTYRGQTVSTPFLAHGILQGTSFWTYSEDLGEIELYFGASLETVLGDNHDPQPKGAVYVAPADGTGDPVQIPRWGGRPWYHSMAHRLKRTMVHMLIGWRNRRFEADWEFLFKDPHNLCPPDHQLMVEQDLDFLEQNPMRHHFISVWNHAVTFLDIIECTTTFLKPDHTNAAEYGFYMSNAILHGLFEIPRRYTLSTLGARDWNDIDLSLIRVAIPKPSAATEQSRRRRRRARGRSAPAAAE